MSEAYEAPNKLDGFESYGDYWVILANQSGRFMTVWRKNGLKVVLYENEIVYVHWVEYSSDMGAYWQTDPQPV